MQGIHQFEYSVIRSSPHVEREEFFNSGIVLYCAGQKFLDTIVYLNEDLVRFFCNELDIDLLRKNIEAFEVVCKGGDAAGIMGKLPIAERFCWLTAPWSTILQTSRPHPGLCDDAGETLERLYRQLVAKG